jgi:ankyrin repeat protein
MRILGFIKLKHHLRLVIQLVVLYGFTVAHAGSYEDFFKAIKQDNPRVVAELLGRGFDPNTLSPSRDFGLILALREPSLLVTEVLLKWPATRVEVRSAEDESPLMLAALHGLTDVCRQLIVRGADVNKPGWAPLHYAATHGHLEVMTLLLEKYAYIDAASPNGTTPLMMAARYGTPDAVKLLLEAGADPMLRNSLGLSAIDFANQAERNDSAALISAFIRGLQPKGSW